MVCPLCSSKDLKGALRHMGTIHAHEAGFYVRCYVQDCPCTYANFHSYKKHLYTKHRAALGLSALTNDSEGTATNFFCSDLDESASNEECFGEDPMDSFEGRKRAAALFVLKAKHVHKIAQSSLSDIMCDFSTMLESTVEHVERDVMAALSDVGIDTNADTLARLNVIFHSQQVCDLFVVYRPNTSKRQYSLSNFTFWYVTT